MDNLGVDWQVHMPDVNGVACVWQVTSEKQKFDSKESNKDLKGIAASMELGEGGTGGASSAAGEEDDLLDLMDGL